MRCIGVDIQCAQALFVEYQRHAQERYQPLASRDFRVLILR